MLNKLKNNWWFYILLAGVVLRLILMPITAHPDLWGHSFTAYFFAYQGKLNIYEYLIHLPSGHPLVRNFGISDIFIYPPLTYYTLGIFRWLVRPFTDPNFIPWLMENLSKVYTHKGLFWHLFAFKLPYLPIDIALAALLANLFNEERKKRLAFALWMFNPLALYATFMIGQLDLLPTFFMVLSLYLYKKERPVWAMISLGVGGSYKMFPLLFVIPAAFILGKSFIEKIKYLFYGFGPFVLTIAPFLPSVEFRQMVLFTPKTQKMLFMGWPVSGAEVIFPFILLLTFLYLFAYYTKRKLSPAVFFLAILLLIFSVTHYHPQWFLWVTPLLIWELVENNFKHAIAVVILFLGWLTITLFFESSLSFGLFAPIRSGLENARSLSEIVGKHTDVFQLKSLVRSVFAGTSLFYVLSLFRLARQEK